MIPYLWLKAVHVASILLFIGGLFSQSFALAAGRGEAQIVAAVSRWDRSVTVPAMLMAWLSGALIAACGAWFGSIWLWIKLAGVLALTGTHGVQSGRLRRLRSGTAGAATPVARTLGLVACAIAVIAALAVTKPV